MAKDILEKLFDELLSGPGAAHSDARKRARAAIPLEPQPENEATLVDIAAHLDATPESGGDAAFIAKLAGDPGTLHEFESAQDFVDRVSRDEEPVPVTLLRLVGAEPAPPRVVRLEAPSSRQISLRRKPLLFWGGAIAAMIIAGVTGYAIRDVLDRGQPQVASVPAPQTGIANPSVAILPPAPDDASNASVPQVFGAVNPPVPVSSHAVGPGDYPPESVQFQEQGTVKVKYLVQKNGTVATCQVEISSGIGRLDDAACLLVRHWLFKPATMSDGSAAEWWLDASVVYKLRNSGLAPPPQPPATASATPAPKTGRAALQNQALAKVFGEAQAAAKTQNWALALEKAKEADAITDDKPAALSPLIHQMVISYAINARDFATALWQLEKNIAVGEGSRLNNVKQALSVAVAAKNREKTEQYASELGNSLDDQARLSVAAQVAQYGQVKEALDYAMPALKRLSPDQSLEIYRLRRVLGDLKAGEDYQTMAQEALIAGYGAEAKSVLDEAATAKLLIGDRAERLMKMANDRAAAERASITDLQIKSATDPNAAIALGMHLWSTGNYSDAEAAIRSAISRGNNISGLDRTKMALGHVLLSEGKIQEAITTFRSVRNLPTGDMIASLWAGYAATMSNSSGATTVTGRLAPQTSVASASPPNTAAATLRPEIAQPLDEAVNAMNKRDFATAIAKLGEADSVANKTPFEEYQVAKFFGLVAINQPMPDYAAAANAYNRQVASGGVPVPEKAGMYNVAMRLNYQTKNFPEVIRDAVELQKLQPLDDTGYLVLLQSYYNVSDFANAAATANREIAAKRAAGKAPSQDVLALLQKSEAALKNSPSSPPVATTSHAVTADDYPPVSIRLQEQGYVGVKYLVKEDGSVSECAVTASSGKSRLDEAACTMVKRRWLFKPATRNGKPVAEYLTAEVVFQLK